MKVRESLLRRLLDTSDFGSLPDHQRLNCAFLAASVVWHVEKLLGNVQCHAEIVSFQQKARLKKTEMLFGVPILSNKLYLRIRLKTFTQFCDLDQELINSIIVAHSICSEQVLDIKFEGLTYYLLEYLEELIISEYVSSSASGLWDREISAMTISTIFDFLRELSGKHYEGSPVEITVGILPKHLGKKKPSDSISLYPFLTSKKTLALFGGHRHILQCDIEGQVHSLRTLKPYPDASIPRHSPIFVAPYEYQPTFDYSRKENALVFILNRFSDILVALSGRLILSRHENVWRICSPDALLGSISLALADFHSKSKRRWVIDVISIYLGMLAFSLRNRRKGGLMVIANREDFTKMSKMKTPNEDSAERFYQKAISERPLASIPVSMLCNAVAVDGATLIDPNGVLVEFGAILKTGGRSGKSEGARTRAAEYASRYGLAIKVSEDGPISVYMRSRLIHEIL